MNKNTGKTIKLLRAGSLAAGCAIGMLLLVQLVFSGLIIWLPYPATPQQPVSSTFIGERTGLPLAAFASDDGQWRLPLSPDQVSPHLFHAIIAAEDARFYDHHGVDWKSVASAAWQDLIHLRIVRGASTISMQVQRLSEPRSRTFLNKIDQAIRAEQLERRRSKSEILLKYVNNAPFGGNLVGAGAASWRYFGRPCSQLSLGQAALLAGLPQSPNRLRPDRHPDRARRRRNYVLDRMLACGFASQPEYDEAINEPLEASWKALPQQSVPSAAFPALVAIAHQHPGQIVRSAFDAAIQKQACQAALRHLDLLKDSGISAAAVVVLDTPTSHCLASLSIGGSDNLIDLVNRPRSTGSTLKPFIYAAAFDAGICSPESVLSDAPAAWPGYEPSDYDRAFRGSISAAEALAESRNIPAMLVLSRLGIEPAIGTMDAAGLHRLARDPQRYGVTLAIGGAEATPLEMAGAYATLGRGGVSLPVSFVHDPATSPTRALRSDACWQVLGALSNPERTMSVCPEAARAHVAWKTGTSSGHHDAWCAAVTHRRTVVVWMGNTGGESSPALVGQEAVAPLALELIAMLDPVDGPWPVVAQKNEVAELRPASRANRLMIVSPSPGQKFVISHDLPLQRQRILLKAAAKTAGRLWWFVDEVPIPAPSNARQLWWDPQPGPHELRVVDEHFQGTATKFSVISDSD